MEGIRNFEDLQVWQKSRLATSFVYTLSRRGEFSKDFGLAGQMQRAAVSIMSNIAEGHERRSQAEFVRFLLIAKGSCAELRAQSYVALDVGYISQTEFDSLNGQAQEIGRMIGGLIASIERNKTP